MSVGEHTTLLIQASGKINCYQNEDQTLHP
jgi:hypothetical protein